MTLLYHRDKMTQEYDVLKRGFIDMSDDWSDLQADEKPKGNLLELTVSELSNALKRSVEDQFGHVRLRGELSGVKRAASGHVYMALKDDNAVLDAVCWRGVASHFTFTLEDGLEVVCVGKITTYPARSKYQMVVEHMEPAGEGALMALLEKRKKQLAAEGLFDPLHKKSIPYLPKTIGVVTSPTGAVIRDILHRLKDRFPRHVLVWPVKVQGKGAAEEIAAAIRGFNAIKEGGSVLRPDLLIVARGGGSIEDLWAFNEEIVVRAAAESTIPLISSVGHETDTTLIDYASDKRAPTPTAAAEMAVPVRADLMATLLDFESRLHRVKSKLIEQRREKLVSLMRGMPKLNDIVAFTAQRLDDLSERLQRGLSFAVTARHASFNKVIGGLSIRRIQQTVAIKGQEKDMVAARLHRGYSLHLKHLGQNLVNTGRLLETLSYKSILDRGFAMVAGPNGVPITSAKDLNEGDAVHTQFKDGVVAMQVTDNKTPTSGKKNESTPTKQQKKIVKTDKDKLQGTLF